CSAAWLLFSGQGPSAFALEPGKYTQRLKNSKLTRPAARKRGFPAARRACPRARRRAMLRDENLALCCRADECLIHSCANLPSPLAAAAGALGAFHALARPSVFALAGARRNDSPADPARAGAGSFRRLVLDRRGAFSHERRAPALSALADGVRRAQRAHLRESARAQRRVVFQPGCGQPACRARRAPARPSLFRRAHGGARRRTDRALPERQNSSAGAVRRIRCVLSTHRPELPRGAGQFGSLAHRALLPFRGARSRAHRLRRNPARALAASARRSRAANEHDGAVHRTRFFRRRAALPFCPLSGGPGLADRALETLKPRTRRSARKILSVFDFFSARIRLTGELPIS